MKVISFRVVACFGIGAVCVLQSSARGQPYVMQDPNAGQTEFTGGTSASGSNIWNSGNSQFTNPVGFQTQDIKTNDPDFNAKVQVCTDAKMKDYDSQYAPTKEELAAQTELAAFYNETYDSACDEYTKVCKSIKGLKNAEYEACGKMYNLSDTQKKARFTLAQIDECGKASKELVDAKQSIKESLEEKKKILTENVNKAKNKKDTEQNRQLAEKNAKLDCAKKFQSQFAQSSDTCAESVNIRLIKESGAKTEEALNAYLDGPGKGRKVQLEKKYGCKIDDRNLAKIGIGSQLLQTGTEAYAVIAGGKASENTAKAFGSGGDVYKAGNEEMGKAAVETGTVQTGISLVQGLAAYKASRIASKHKKAAAELDTGGFDTDKICEQGDTKCLSAISSADMAGKKFGQGASTGRSQIESAKDKHLAMAEKASDQALQIGAKAVTNLAGGLNTIAYGNKLKDVAANMAPPPTVSPQLVPFAGVGGGDGAPPPTYQNPTSNLNESPITEQTLAKDDAAGGDMNLAPPLLGPPTEGGIKGDVPAPDNTIAGSGGGGADGGAGGGSLGGGSGGGEETPEDDGSGQNLSGGVSKFEGTGGGGPTFTSTGGSDKRRVNDTGEMNLNALLEKLMGKKEEEKPQGSILDYGGGKGGERGLAAAQDDGSILGPNSNLFARVSNTMVANFKKGNLR